MGESYGAICNECYTRLEVNEGPGMSAMPLRCESCGREWWWEFGAKGPSGDPEPPPPRCPRCASTSLRRDPDGVVILYD